ncbi:hypothetical protein MIC448_780014 [Microbacterium sp. C448]|nr:hypothetical protein MIC448_780014 [Microbacterium sp. C448]
MLFAHLATFSVLVAVTIWFVRQLLHGRSEPIAYEDLTLEKLKEMTEGDFAALREDDVEAWRRLRDLDVRQQAIHARAAAIHAE